MGVNRVVRHIGFACVMYTLVRERMQGHRFEHVRNSPIVCITYWAVEAFSVFSPYQSFAGLRLSVSFHTYLGALFSGNHLAHPVSARLIAVTGGCSRTLHILFFFCEEHNLRIAWLSSVFHRERRRLATYRTCIRLAAYYTAREACPPVVDAVCCKPSARAGVEPANQIFDNACAVYWLQTKELSVT